MTTAAVASEHHNHSLKVGKKGEITLTQPTKVGDKVLQPDTYIVQHRTSNDKHFVRFLELKQAQTVTGSGYGGVVAYSYPVKDNAGEIECRMEPSAAPIKETMVSIAHEHGGDRITQVVIKGEDVVHIF
jgi:hypothetical protein